MAYYHVVLACSTLLNLSVQTKVEMAALLPKVGEYCLATPTGSISVVYAPKVRPTKEKSNIMQQGSAFYEAYNGGIK